MTDSSSMPLFLFLLTLLVLLLALANMIIGSVELSWSDIFSALTSSPQTPAAHATHFIVMHHRIPQLLTAMMAGAALSGSGLALQTLFRNPLADPSLLGINSGAGLGAAVALLLFGGILPAGDIVLSGFGLVLACAFLGAIFAMTALLIASRWTQTVLHLLLVGVMIAAIASSLIALLNFFSTSQGVHSFVIWGMGDFSAVGSTRLLPFALALAPALVALFFLTKSLDTLLLGEDYARSLGTPVATLRWTLLAIVGWLSAVVTAVCGPIAFIGLAAPHLARLLFRTATHRRLLPATLLMGMALCLLCLLISRLPGSNGTLPINALTPLIGAPLILFFIFKHR